MKKSVYSAVVCALFLGSLMIPANSFAYRVQNPPTDVPASKAVTNERPVFPLFSLPCTSSSSTSHSVFVDSSQATSGDGTYASPYNRLFDALTDLQSSSRIRTLCLTGTFSESLDLDSIATTTLTVYGYNGGATISAATGASAVSTPSSSSMSSSSLTSLTLTHLDLASDHSPIDVNGLSAFTVEDVSLDASDSYYGGHVEGTTTVTLSNVSVSGDEDTSYSVSIDGADVVTVKDSTIDASGAYYGLRIGSGSSRVGVLTLDNVVVQGNESTASGISIENTGEATLTEVNVTGTGYNCVKSNDVDTMTVENSTFEDCGPYALDVDADHLEVTDNQVSGYTYTGVTASGDYVYVSKNVISGGSIATNGLDIAAVQEGFLYNNFILDHQASGAILENSSNNASVYNNSFSNNGTGVDTDGGGDHSLTVNLVNNIFSSNSDQKAFNHIYSRTFTAPPSDENTSLSIVSNHNLYNGDVTEIESGTEDLSAWQTESGDDADSIEGDPLFVSSTDLHLQSGSPAINVGTTLTIFNDDIDGEFRGSTYDIGADDTSSFNFHVMEFFP